MRIACVFAVFILAASSTEYGFLFSISFVVVKL